MKRIIILIVWVWMGWSVMAQAESSVTQADFFSETLNRTYQYTVYLPAGYDESTHDYPVIYLLHGRGDTMSAWLNVCESLDDLIDSGGIPPVIAVLPETPSSERGHYYVDSQYTGFRFRAESVESAFMNDLIPHVDATYRTLSEREGRLVGGYSMGGYGALRYVMTYPQTFAGAIVLSPAVYTPLPPLDSSTREFGAFGVDDVLFDETIYQRLNYPSLVADFEATSQRVGLFIAVGDDEWKHPNPEDQRHDLDLEAHLAFNTLARVQTIDAEFRVYDGGHDWAVWRRGFVEGMRFLSPMLQFDSA